LKEFKIIVKTGDKEIIGDKKINFKINGSTENRERNLFIELPEKTIINMFPEEKIFINQISCKVKGVKNG
jgi:hypothetical protein